MLKNKLYVLVLAFMGLTLQSFAQVPDDYRWTFLSQSDVDLAQAKLRDKGLDGWLFSDFHRRNPIAVKFLGFRKEAVLTRRYFYYIPANGKPTAFVPKLEKKYFKDLPGEKVYFSSYKLLEEALQTVLPKKGTQKPSIAMEISKFDLDGPISYVDAGTAELIRGFNINVTSSFPLKEDIFPSILRISKSNDTESSESDAAERVPLEVNLPQEKLTKIQNVLRQVKTDRKKELDGWLLVDQHCRNRVARELLQMGTSACAEKPMFFFIPKSGPASLLVNKASLLVKKITSAKLNAPAKLHIYESEQEIEDILATIFEGMRTDNHAPVVAMEYSFNNRLPYNAYVGEDLISFVREENVEVVTSADLVSVIQSALDEKRIASHRKASALNMKIKDEAMDYIRRKISSNENVFEYEVSKFIYDRYQQEGMIMPPEELPIVAVDGNAGNPHYYPTESRSAQIKSCSLVLIDMWPILEGSEQVYSDITWMAYVNDKKECASAPQEYKNIFQVVLNAQKAAFDYIANAFEKGEPAYGALADDASRDVVKAAGYGDLFVHRTGHSIDSQVHGNGPNIDNLETNDRRQLLEGHVFSLEPGIYNPEKGWGFRSEINVMITKTGPVVTTTPQQTQIVELFSWTKKRKRQ